MDFVIKRKVLIAMLFTALSMLGYISYKQLPVELYPNATLPMLFVQVATPLEVDPKYMENQAIIPLEGAIGTLEGIEKIQSTAGQQQGSIQISYQKNTDIKYAFLKLSEKVDEAKKQLPEEFRVQVFKFDLEQLNNGFMTVQVRGSGGVDRVRQVTDKEIINKIKNVDGVANAEVFGGREKSIEITLNKDVCDGHGISASDVRTALSSNSRSKTFAGRVIENDRLHFVNVIAEFDNINDIHNLVVKGSIRLKDIATIHYGVKEQDSYSRVNGMEAVTVSLTKDSQANVIDLSNRVKEQIAALNQDMEDKEIEIVIQSNSADTMEKNIDSIIELALVGGLLAIFILWIFLRNLRLVVAIALAIPISVYTAFNFFYAFGITINSLTLLGMALAIGMLLDNSIVVLENIYRLASKKVNRNDAVIKGTGEVWRSIFAATLTTVTVFLPFVFSDNFFIGLIGKHIGVSIISTLLVSLAVALLLIPAITHTLLGYRKNSGAIQFEKLSLHNRMIQIYMVLLKTSMRSPGKTILGALIAFFVALLISLAVSFTSSQEAEIKELKLYVSMPSGSTLDKTDVIVAEAEKKLIELQERKDIVSQVYEEEAVITILLQDDYRDLRNFSIPKIKNDIIEQLRDLNPATFGWDPPPTSRRFGGGGGEGFDEDDGFARMLGIGTQRERVILRGQDFDKMLNHANDVKFYLSQLTSIEKVDIRLPEKRPEVNLTIDKQLLSMYNIPVTSILSELNSFQHEFSSGVRFKQGVDEYDIIIKTIGADEKKERNLGDLRKLTVRGTDGVKFDLQELSSFNFSEGLSSIRRTNQEKQLSLVYQFTPEIRDSKDLLEAARFEVDELVSGISLPSGIALEVIHEDDDLSEFAFLLFMAFILIYMILSSVFESFTTPIVMMFSIPMAGIGSLALLILTGTSILNTNVLTGFLILLGIVVNNGIILIDYSRLLRKQGYNESRALMLAGLSRVRPILITAITTIIALVPLAMGKSEYVALIGVPFAVTIIGGLTVSTLLTLVFIPTLSSGMQSALKWMNSQKIYIKIIQTVIWVTLSYLIFTEVDTRVWQIIDFILVIIIVPASIYFVQNSLRKASEKLIGKDDPLNIHIRNLVKIYDWDSRFVREWKSGLNIRRRLGISNEFKSFADLVELFWEVPLVGFMVYLIYFHVESGFWYFVLPIFFYLITALFLSPLKDFAGNLGTGKGQRLLRFWLIFVNSLFVWAYPALAMFLFYNKFKLLGLVIPIGVVWYILVLIKVTSDMLYKQKVDVNRIKGNFKGARQLFFRFVLTIPIIGKKKIPFKAVRGVTIDIRNGMFGLLGPNGAGKSTLMKIICGVLEQSYGKITINGIDLQQKREELQGLIGYLPQEFGMYENMTAWEFLNYMGILKKIYNQQERYKRVEYVLGAVHMVDHMHEKIGSFSGGMKQRIGIAQILLHLPRILVVDEPTAGLDPRERIRFRNLLVELSKDRIVIFSTHIIEDVASSCNMVAVMNKGYVKYQGAPLHMAKIAENKVWSLQLAVADFERIKDKLVVIHHIKEGDFIRCRCLADESPTPDAKSVKANLEDAYLYLISERG